MAGNKIIQTKISGVLLNSPGMDRTSIFNALQIAGSDIKDTKKVSDELYNMSKAGYVIKQSIANSAASKWLLTTAGRTEFAPLIKLSAPVADAQVDEVVDQLIEQAAERAADAPIVINQEFDRETIITAAIDLLQNNGFHVIPPRLTIQNKASKLQVLESLAGQGIGMFHLDIVETLKAIKDDLSTICEDNSHEATA